MDQELAGLLKAFPPLAEMQRMSPEELAPFVLKFLKDPAQANSGMSNRSNFMSRFPAEVTLALIEAWMWLEHEGFLVPKPGQLGNSEWLMLSRKAMAMRTDAELTTYLQARIFPDGLNDVLAQLVRPMFLRGDYDTAVFRAFKEVEVRVREKAGLANNDIGRELMVKAFGPTGPLTDIQAPRGEQDAARELFAGAISFCKNPSSHREVQFDDPREVVDLICFANQLLRIVARLPSPT